MSRPTRNAPPPPPEAEHEKKGASANERLLAAAKSDNEGMLEEALAELQDVNYTDGLGNTALHYAIIHASTNVLEPLLEHESCDVDIRNRLARDTPLHIAVRQRWEEYPGLRLHLVTTLLEAGADTTIKNRHSERPIDLLPPSPEKGSDDDQIRSAIRQAAAEAQLADTGDVIDEDAEALLEPDDIASDSD